LRKQTVSLDSYSFLVGMVYEIKKRPLGDDTLNELRKIVAKNSYIT